MAGLGPGGRSSTDRAPVVQEVTVDGVGYRVRVLGGAGAGAAALKTPVAVEVGPSGQIYVADAERALVRVFDREGRPLRTLGAGHLQRPKGLAVAPDGAVYVTDLFLDAVLVFGADGRLLRRWGETGDGLGQLRGPSGIALAPDQSVLVVDQQNHRVLVFRPDGRLLRTIGAEGSALSLAPGELFFPTGVAVSAAGEVYVTDTVHSRVQVFDLTGGLLRMWGEPGKGPGELDRPFGIELARDGTVYVVDRVLRYDGNDRVQAFDGRGTLRWRIGQPGPAAGQFAGPMDVAVTADGTLLVAEAGNHRVQAIERSAPPTSQPASDAEQAPR